MTDIKETPMWNGEQMTIVGSGENIEAEPVEVSQEWEYGMLIPICPKCREVAYNESFCVFCGQRFIVHKQTEEERIAELKKRISGAKWNGRFFACVDCGEDIDKSTDMVGFFDGMDGGGTMYRCRCGKSIFVRG